MKKYDEWNAVKKNLDNKKEIIEFKQRDIFWLSLGENIGFEQILVVKKLNKQLFFGVPLSTTLRNGTYFYNFKFIDSVESSALLVQAKVFDIKRVDKKIGMINQEDFKQLQNKLGDLLGL
ncbi:MAG: type II toxin-antitoxin system PemK/MazF family toxin [Campylobacterota bacterium]|nr:type II toxin-antitoxin system PemK/MazF family toxin [Campylobacterota bacterium]